MKSLIRGLAVFLGVAVVLVATAYLTAAVLVERCGGLGKSLAWAASDPRDRPAAIGRPLGPLADAGRTICGLHFLYGFDWFADAVAPACPDEFLADNRRLAASIPAGIRWLCLATAVAAFASGLVVAAGCVWPRRWVAWRRPPCDTSMRRNPHCFAFGALAVLAFLVYAAANALWLSPGVGRWVVLVPLAALLAAMRLAGWSRGRWASWAAVAMVAAMYLTNLWGSVLPQASPRGDDWHGANACLIREAPP